MTFGPCADHNTAAPYRGEPRQGYCATCARIEKEGKIARRTIRTLKAAGYWLRVHDGEEFATPRTRSERELMAALFTTDDDRLFVYRSADSKGHAGWVWLVYGNSGWDVISDHTTNLEDVLRPVMVYAETLEDR